MRSQVEEAMRAGRIPEGLAIMSAHSSSDFPPGWDPPPRVGYGETSPDLRDVLNHLVDREDARWVRVTYLEKLVHSVNQYQGVTKAQAEEFSVAVQILRQMSDGPAVAKRLVRELNLQNHPSWNSVSELEALAEK